MSGRLKDRLRRMLTRATQLGIGLQIALDLRAIVQAVTNRPRVWGDPVRHFAHVQQMYYHGHHANFLGIYSVHDRIPMAFLIDVVPLEGNPLFGGNYDADA
jgi:hypothetical protein